MQIDHFEIIYAETPDELSRMIRTIVKNPVNYRVRLHGPVFTYNGPCGFRIAQAMVEEKDG